MFAHRLSAGVFDGERGSASGVGGPGRPGPTLLERVARAIVRGRVVVLLLAVLSAIPALYGMRHVKVEYDLLKYLPRTLSSVKGVDLLNRHFGFSSVASLVIRGCPDWRVQQIKERVEHTRGVSRVFWFSDVADPSVPLAFQRELVDEFYRKDATIMQVQFAESISDQTYQAIRSIRDGLEPGQELVGPVVTLADLRGAAEKEKPKLIIMAVISIACILLLTMPSFITPILFLTTLGLSVVLNLGLSYYLGGRISYLTDSFAGALQLGVTMDYCIFLLHRFEEETARHPSVEEAMVQALRKTLVAILASSMTTVAGFATLGFMRIGIGADFGFTLARGVLIAVVATATVLPALILIGMPLIKRFGHRSLLPRFSRLGPITVRLWVPLLIVLLAAAVPAWYGHAHLKTSYDLEQSFSDEMPSMKSLKTLRRQYGVADTANVITRNLPSWTNIALEERIARVPGIQSASSYLSRVGVGVPENFVPTVVRDRYLAGDYYNIDLTLAGRTSDPARGAAFNAIRKMLEPVRPRAYLTGQAVVNKDMERLAREDMNRIDLITPFAIGAIVAVSFMSLSIPVLLVLLILVAIWINQSIVFFTGGSLFFFAAVALSCIQLGSTVDYAILMTSRFREERVTHSAREAVALAVNRCGGALLTSAMTLFAATIGIYLISSLALIKELALLLARGAIISMLAASLLLPAVLIVWDGVSGRKRRS